MSKIIKAKDAAIYVIDDQGNHIKIGEVAHLTVDPNLTFKKFEPPTLTYTQKAK